MLTKMTKMFTEIINFSSQLKLLIAHAYVLTESEYHTAKKPNFCIANKYFNQSQWLCRTNVAFVSYETNNLPASDRLRDVG